MGDSMDSLTRPPSAKLATPRISTSTYSAIDEKPPWVAPPMPPMPDEHESEAWRRRSALRQSYTSQMSCNTSASARHCLGADSAVKTTRSVPDSSRAADFRPRSTVFSRDSARVDAYAELHFQISALNPRNWGSRKKWVHVGVVGVYYDE